MRLTEEPVLKATVEDEVAKKRKKSERCFSFLNILYYTKYVVFLQYKVHVLWMISIKSPI